MNFIAQTVFEELIHPQNEHVISDSTMHGVIDLTLLNTDAQPHELANLLKQATHYQVAAICVYPKHLNQCQLPLNIKRATVSNFPSGQENHFTVLQQIEEAITNENADEIDYVFPYKLYLQGQKEHALTFCQEAYDLTQQKKRTFKVILETGAFPSSEDIYEASLAIIDHGCNFLKTSTGKITTGATLPAAYAIISAIKHSGAACGVKISGGIRTRNTAHEFMNLAQNMLNRPIEKQWFRLGMSCIPMT